MWHCNEKNVKPGISRGAAEKWRKSLKIVKDPLHEGFRVIKIAYMTGTMRTNANHVTANRRAVLTSAIG
ncbi:hypothetical protein I6F35_33040 [Bradyrhizobium sp. BRP22]|uniref:hypothetical protein n=1 Tax=Bradyrhizobium sp. BRP22 TaxID=2793821 RepID=UPI001CD7C565|nr:hypothetical protein [Bradyrhizobium sp. BRP22]MCA1457961.1 hypothetical protein [Bradyrhizobium sp. BRP22]